MTVLRFDSISRVYAAFSPVYALKSVTTVIQQGDFVAIEGPSGAGKSTFLNILALLDTPTAGKYIIDDCDVAELRDTDLARLRSNNFSFIFQSFHLISTRTALDNAMLGLVYRGMDQQQCKRAALEALRFVGLDHKAHHRASELSGGECQRVAIARAIATGAPVLVADEPTGNLDSVNSDTIMALLEELNSQGKTVIVVTHDPDVAQRATRRLLIADGEMTDLTPHRVPPCFSERRCSEAANGKASISWRMFISDACLSITSATRRSVGLVVMVLLSVAVALATVGLSQTARFQVTDAFDVNLNRRVAMSSAGEGDEAQKIAYSLFQSTDEETIARILAVPGVEAASIVAEYNDVGVRTMPMGQSTDARLYGIFPDEPNSRLFDIQSIASNGRALADDEVLIGSGLARSLDLGPLVTSPTVWIQSEPFRVVGVVSDAGLRAEIPNALLMKASVAASLAPLRAVGMELRTTPGSAQQVAKYAPLAWNPVLADQLTIVAPADPSAMRDTIDSNVQSILVTLALVTMMSALLALTNSMAVGVQRRIGEFGMRRAIGCRRRDLAFLVAAESTILGLSGGIGGTVVGIMAILVVTIIRGWQPVMDLSLVPLGVAGGIVVGVISSILAICRAIQITPAEALRSV